MSNELLIGYVGIVMQSSDGAPCFDSQDALDDAVKAAVAHDSIGWAEQVADHAVTLHAGDRVRGIDSGGFMGAERAQVRIESGDNRGTACWFERQAVDLKNVHNDSGQ